jgi:hypothetical protein
MCEQVDGVARADDGGRVGQQECGGRGVNLTAWHGDAIAGCGRERGAVAVDPACWRSSRTAQF